MTAVGTAQNQVQTGIYNALTGDSTLMSLLSGGGVFDASAVPQNQAFPYITLGDCTETQADTMDGRTYELTYTPHIWAIGAGFKACQAIFARMNWLLHRQPLSLATQTHVGTWYMNMRIMEDPDGIHVQGIATYHIRVQEPLV